MQGGGLLAKFNWHLQEACVDAFPEFREHKDATTKQLRELLRSFAQDMEFDPLIPDNWKTITKEQVIRAKVCTLSQA